MVITGVILIKMTFKIKKVIQIEKLKHLIVIQINL